MANRYWVGATSTSWTAAANWSATSGGAGGASIPTMADDVFLDAGSTRNCFQTGKGEQACRNFTVTSGFSHHFNLDSDSGSLKIHGNVNIQKANFWSLSTMTIRGQIIIAGSTNTTINVPNPIGGTLLSSTPMSKKLIVSKTGGARARLLSNLDIGWVYIAVNDTGFISENMVIENDSLDTNGYRLVTHVLKAPNGTDADITFKPLPAEFHKSNNGNIVFNGDVVFNRGSVLIPGNTFTYTFNGPVTFGTTGGAVKTTVGQGSIAKSSGVFMAREANVVNSTASGGALFRAPTNLGNTNGGGNTGWDFSSSIQTLSTAGASHQHYADSADITVASTLVVAGSHHGTSSQSPGMTRNVTVVAESSSVSVSSASVSLVRGISLFAEDATHEPSSSSVALVQKHTLSVSGASSATSSDSIVVSQEHLLTPSDSVSGITSGAVTLSQVHSLTPASAVHGVTSDNLQFSGELFIGVHDSIMYQTAQAASIVQAHTIAASSSVHGLASDELSATENRTLLANSTGHTLGSQLDKLLQQHLLSSHSTSHALRSDNVILAEFYRLIAHSTSHGLTSSNVDIDQYLLLNKPDDSVIGIASPEIWLVSEQFLQIDDSRHRLFSVNVSIVNWDKLGVGFGRYRPGYDIPGIITEATVDKGSIRRGYKTDGRLTEAPKDSGGRLRIQYKDNGRFL